MFDITAEDKTINYHLGENILANLLQPILKRSRGRAFVIVDDNVGRLQKNYLLESFKNSQAFFYTVSGGEKSKNLGEIKKIYDSMLEYGTDRSVPVIAVGGGVVGDISGLAASTFMRGLPFVQVPSSLLAMVDSSIGGKNGVDLPEGKNLVGSFYNPELIVADLTLLRTLPAIEWSNGLAELIKTSLVSHRPFFKDIEKFCTEGYFEEKHNVLRTLSLNDKLSELGRNKKMLCSWIISAVNSKAAIVSADPFDLEGERYKLNLGHTFAHSLEVTSNYSLAHGQAVSIGIICALLLADSLGILEEDLIWRMKETLSFWGLPVIIPHGLDWEKFAGNLRSDKKRKNGHPVFVVPVAEGKTVLCGEVSPAKIKEVFISCSAA
ncbi:MAG: 3-dehydroquinate synthase [Candidatus Bruticola sp.]